jgi:hypothetical protein
MNNTGTLLSYSNQRRNSVVSIESVSTNATEGNRPGAGRGLGQLYDAAGVRLERGLGRLAHRLRRRRSQSTSTSSGTSPYTSGSPATSQTSLSSYTTRFTLSTNATLPNLPGAGRFLGNVYDSSGRALEKGLNALATQAGLGPDACMLRIKAEMREEGFIESAQLAAAAHRSPKKLFELVSEKKVTEECKRMLRYAR